MGQRRIIFVYNPVAHGGKLVDKAVSTMKSLYDNVIFHMIRPHEDGFGKLAEVVKTEKPDCIIIAGGDGTLNKYFNYAFQHNIADIPIGIIPSGTANDFAGSLGIPNQINKAIKRILSGEPHATDIMSVESGGKTEYCINVFSSGYLTCVSHTTNDKLKKRIGRLAYFVHGISEAIHPRKMILKCISDNFVYNDKALLILVLNGKTAGKMPFAKNADPLDGLLDVIIFKGNSIVMTIISAIKMFMGFDYKSDVIKEKSSYLVIKSDSNQETDLDGDRGPSYPISIKCLKGAIKVIY